MDLFSAVFVLLVASASAWWIPYAGDSCAERCNDPLDGAFTCQCNYACENYNDCCADYHYLCLGPSNSCNFRCGEDYDSRDNCHCNSRCKEFDNCCGDYDGYCLNPGPTNEPPVTPIVTSGPPAPTTCAGKCEAALDPSQPCQCNAACLTYGDCCPDYSELCGGGGGGDITPAELSTLADDLWASDGSRALPSEYTINKQAKVNDGNTADQSPLPFFTYVNEAAVFSRPTFAAFISLIDNYNPQYGVNEVVTPEEQVEYQHFMDTIMATKTMTKTANFLISKGYFATKDDLRAKIDEAWFTLYDRSSPTDSSGFEHVYLGEYKSGNKVNGFHNWVQFYKLEQAGSVNYLGYVREDAPNFMMGANFQWNGYNKALGSFMYGASPEFELAMMTTCFTAFPGKLCTFNLNGNPIAIQTYTQFTKYVGSSYFSV